MKVVVALGRQRAAQARRADDGRRTSAPTSGSRPSASPASPASTSSSSRTATARRSACWRSRRDAYKEVEAYPLDILGAETQGMIGYLVEQELGNLLPVRGAPGDRPHDGRGRPRRPGLHRSRPSSSARSTTRQRPSALAAEKGWTVKPDGAVLAPRRPVAQAEADLRDPPDALAARAGRRRDLRRRRRHPDDVRRGRGPPARRRRGRDRQGPRHAACSRGSSTPTCS